MILALFRGALRFLTWAAAAAAVLAGWFAAAAPRGTVTPVWLLSLTAAFWMALVPVFIPAVLLAAWTGCRQPRDHWNRHIDGWAAAMLVAALFFGRLEPAHQLMLPSGAHVSLIGALDLIMLAAAALAIWQGWAPPHGRTSSWPRALGRMALIVAGLEGAALAQDPAGNRSQAAAEFRVETPSDPREPGTPERVLFIGVDGLDWRVLSALTKEMPLPGLQRLIDNSERWALDNRDLRRSPEIWASLHTGVEPQYQSVGGFAAWRLFEDTAVVRVHPYFGPHRPFLVEHLLANLSSNIWDLTLVTGEQLSRPTFWELASDAGLPTVVVSPFPFTSPLLAIEGRMATYDAALDAWSVAETRRGATTVTRLAGSALGPFKVPDDELLVMHEQRVAMSEKLFREEHPRLGVFYTSIVDEMLHATWRRDCGLVGECAYRLNELARAPIAAVYRQVDADIERLISAFGPGATIVLASDHGWEPSEFTHVFGPDGVLVIGPSASPAFRGRTDIYRIAPTILHALGLAAEPGMVALDVDGHPLAQRPENGDYARRVLRPAAKPSAERLELLRAIGYIAR